jgi:hypothetical protein
VRLAVEAADSFNDWTEAGLRLLRRGRVGGGAPPKADEVESAAGALAKDFGARDQRAKSRAVELLGQMVKFTPWDEIPPVKAHAGSVLPTPEPSPKPVVP